MALSANTRQRMNEAIDKYKAYFKLEGRCTDNGEHAIEYLNKMLKEQKHWAALYANEYVHLGSRTSNRAESTHASLKQFAQTSSSKLDLVTQKIS
ncbi:hypothetical protein RMATCC62417_16781 [Rhizopus microsporus]|nr:hypothetical protein RMATCC62417_16781 [Rhizopus microsporus]